MSNRSEKRKSMKVRLKTEEIRANFFEKSFRKSVSNKKRLIIALKNELKQIKGILTL